MTEGTQVTRGGNHTRERCPEASYVRRRSSRCAASYSPPGSAGHYPNTDYDTGSSGEDLTTAFFEEVFLGNYPAGRAGICHITGYSGFETTGHMALANNLRVNNEHSVHIRAIHVSNPSVFPTLNAVTPAGAEQGN